MHIMVHGFFGKYATKHLEENDVVEMKIDNALLAKVFEKVANIKRHKSASVVSGDAFNPFSNDCVVKLEDLPDFLRAIMLIVNITKIKSSSDLTKLSEVMRTAQRYKAPIYYL